MSELIWSFEGFADSSSTTYVSRFYKTLCIGNGCLRSRTRSSAESAAREWTGSTDSLCQSDTIEARTELWGHRVRSTRSSLGHLTF